MMHKAWYSIQEVTYYFSGSSIKCQRYTGWKIADFTPIWVRLLGQSQLSNPSDLPCDTNITLPFTPGYSFINRAHMRYKPNKLPYMCDMPERETKWYGRSYHTVWPYGDQSRSPRLHTHDTQHALLIMKMTGYVQIVPDTKAVEIFNIAQTNMIGCLKYIHCLIIFFLYNIIH